MCAQNLERACDYHPHYLVKLAVAGAVENSGNKMLASLSGTTVHVVMSGSHKFQRREPL